MAYAASHMKMTTLKFLFNNKIEFLSFPIRDNFQMNTNQMIAATFGNILHDFDISISLPTDKCFLFKRMENYTLVYGKSSTSQFRTIFSRNFQTKMPLISNDKCLIRFEINATAVLG